MNMTHEKREKLVNNLEFVVTGTGRCGTLYTYQLLNHLGIPTSHEYIMNAGDPKYLGMQPLDSESPIAECSWMTYPYTEDLALAFKKTVHLIRDPLATIKSLIGSNFMYDKNGKKTIWFDKVCQRFLSRDNGPPILQAIRFYLAWNKNIFDQANFGKYYCIRIEDMNDFVEFSRMSTFLGYSFSSKKFYEAIKDTISLNHKNRDESITWNDIRKYQDGETIYELARTFDYV